MEAISQIHSIYAFTLLVSENKQQFQRTGEDYVRTAAPDLAGWRRHLCRCPVRHYRPEAIQPNAGVCSRLCGRDYAVDIADGNAARGAAHRRYVTHAGLRHVHAWPAGLFCAGPDAATPASAGFTAKTTPAAQPETHCRAADARHQPAQLP
ncbi:hypothetical protein D3C78_1129180 [compost metagenome]